MTPEDLQNIRNGVDPKWANAPIIDNKGNTLHPGNPDPNSEHNLSILMDENGKPQTGFVAYHGSQNNFDKFDINKYNDPNGASSLGQKFIQKKNPEPQGIYLSQNKKLADWYANRFVSNRGNTYSVFVNGDPNQLARADRIPEYNPQNVQDALKKLNLYDKFIPDITNKQDISSLYREGVNGVHYPDQTSKSLPNSSKKEKSINYRNYILFGSDPLTILKKE
jgi:hypothetical protein